MLKELISKSGMKVDDILCQVREDYERWYDMVQSKRSKFEIDLNLYNNQRKQKEKVWDTTVYNIHSALMARLYLWKTDIKFEWTKIGLEYVADNVNACYQEDFEAEDMEVVKYQAIWDALFYWVGIVAKTWWEWLQKRTKFQCVDPRLWIPDPDWDYLTGNYSFVGFEKMLSKADLLSMNMYNKDLAPKQYTGNWYRWPDRVLTDDQQRAGLTPYQWWVQTQNPSFNLYYHFWIFNWVKAMVVTGNDNTEILKVEVLKPVFDWEKKDQTKTPFPFKFAYYRPERWNPFGRSVVDDTWDVQRIKAILANLRLDKSKAELYPMYLYNTRLVKNRADLDFWFNKMIAVNPLEWEPISNAITPLQKDFRADNSFVIDQSLDQQVERATSIGALAQWSETSRRETATTNKLTQWNTDINLSVTAKHLNWCWRWMAELWYRGLIENFTNGDTKSIKLYNGITYVPMELRRKDLVFGDRFKITIKSDMDKTEKQQREVQAFNMALPLLQSLQLPKASLNYAYRDFLRNLGYDEKKIWATIPQTPEEVKIQQDVELLNAGVSILPEPDVDVETALLMLKQANPWPKKDAYMAVLLELYTMNKQQEMPMEEDPNQQSMQNNVVAQAGAGLQNMAQQFTW